MATIRDVAARAGVSPATVSRVLNQPDIVVDETRRRVERAVADLGFRPNRIARSLKSNVFRMIALIVADITNPFFGMVAKGVDECCQPRDYGVLLCNADHQTALVGRLLADLPRRGVDGIILFTGDRLSATAVAGEIAELIRGGMPIVMAGQKVEGLTCPLIQSDQVGAGHLATKHLITQDLLPIAFAGGVAGSVIAEERFQGYARALEDAGIEVDSYWHVPAPFSFEGGRRAGSELLQRERRPRSVVAANDQIAIGVMRAVWDHGLRIPDDMAVVGFDDIAFAEYVQPALTTVRVQADELGRLAAKALFSVIDGGSPPPVLEVPRELIVRESSQRRILDESAGLALLR